MNITVKLPDGEYHRRWIVKKIDRSDGTSESFTHDSNNERVIKKSLSNNRFLEIDYYRLGDNWVWPGANFPVTRGFRAGHVMRLKAPVGHDATPINRGQGLQFCNFLINQLL